MGLSLIIEQMITYFLCLVGISMLIRASVWVSLIEWLSQLPQKSYSLLALSLGFLFIITDLFIVTTHNIWEWNPSVIVTITGWEILIITAVGLLFPVRSQKIFSFLQKQGSRFLTFLFRGLGILYLILFSILIYY